MLISPAVVAVSLRFCLFLPQIAVRRHRKIGPESYGMQSTGLFSAFAAIIADKLNSEYITSVRKFGIADRISLMLTFRYL